MRKNTAVVPKRCFKAGRVDVGVEDPGFWSLLVMPGPTTQTHTHMHSKTQSPNRIVKHESLTST